MNADIRIYPDKELKAVDMAVILDALEVADGAIQGCEVSLSSGVLSISDGRILLKGRLGVVTASTIELPTLASAATCHLLAVCDLAIDPPFYIALFSAEEYETLVERVETVTDFNGLNGVAFVELGTADVDPNTSAVTSWTANDTARASRVMDSYIQRTGGNWLPDDINIDNLSKKHSGWWVYDRSVNGGTFPVTDSYGTIGHIQGTSDSVAMQFLRSNNQSRVSSILWIRYKMGGAWGVWLRYIAVGTVNLTIARVNNSYCTANDLSELAASKKNGWMHLRGNLRISSTIPNGTMNVHIATISGWSSPRSEYLNVPSRYGEETIRVTVSSDGKIYISNYSASTYGEFFFSLTVPTTDGNE